MKVTRRCSPRCNSRCPTARALKGAYCTSPFPNGCHRRMPLLRGPRLIASPVQLSPAQGGREAAGLSQSRHSWVHESVPICACAPRRRRCNEARQKPTNNGRHDTADGKNPTSTLAQQTDNPRKPGSQHVAYGCFRGCDKVAPHRASLAARFHFPAATRISHLRALQDVVIGAPGREGP